MSLPYDSAMEIDSTEIEAKATSNQFATMAMFFMVKKTNGKWPTNIPVVEVTVQAMANTDDGKKAFRG